MSRTENRYGQATIPPGACLMETLDAISAAIEDALGVETWSAVVAGDETGILFDQIQLSSEIVADEERTFSGTHRTNERNVLTVRLPVVFDD